MRRGLTAAIPMENPYCSCKLTSHDLQLAVPMEALRCWLAAHPAPAATKLYRGAPAAAGPPQQHAHAKVIRHGLQLQPPPWRFPAAAVS